MELSDEQICHYIETINRSSLEITVKLEYIFDIKRFYDAIEKNKNLEEITVKLRYDYASSEFIHSFYGHFILPSHIKKLKIFDMPLWINDDVKLKIPQHIEILSLKDLNDLLLIDPANNNNLRKIIISDMNQYSYISKEHSGNEIEKRVNLANMLFLETIELNLLHLCATPEVLTILKEQVSGIFRHIKLPYGCCIVYT